MATDDFFMAFKAFYFQNFDGGEFSSPDLLGDA